MIEIDEPARSVIEAYRQAVFDRDVDAFMRLYEPGARVFDTWDVWSYEGAGEWRRSVERWLTSLGDERVRVTAEQVQVCGEGSLRIVSALIRYAAISSEGEELRAIKNRLSWALRSDGGAWKIAHEHTSVPST